MRACVQTDRTVNAEGSHLALKTVCSALFMLLCIDDTVSLAAGSWFFFFPSAILTRSSSGEGGRSESDGEAKPFCCCFIHILGAPPSWQRGELPAVSQYPSLIAAAPPVNPVSVSPFAAFALMPFELIKLALAHLFSWLLLPLN